MGIPNQASRSGVVQKPPLPPLPEAPKERLRVIRKLFSEIDVDGEHPKYDITDEDLAFMHKEFEYLDCIVRSN
jgi:hypothetical protein